MPAPTVIASWTRTMLECARERGVEPAALLSGLELPAGILESPEGRIPSEIDYLLWERAARLVGIPAFGLAVASRFVELRTFGVVGFVIGTSATLHDSLLRLQELQQLVSDDGSFLFEVDEQTGVGEAVIVPSASRARLPPDLAEALLASIVVVARSCTGHAVAPRAVRFQHARPRHARTLGDFFGGPVRFGCADNALSFSPRWLALPMQGSAAGVNEYLRDLAETRLQAQPTETSLAAAVNRAIGDALEHGELGLAQVARRMNLGVRTLQRRLREQGLAYQELVDDVRSELARRYLAAADLPVREIAARLGFARRSAFRRAFRRWTGRTPRGFRAAAREATPGPRLTVSRM